MRKKLNELLICAMNKFSLKLIPDKLYLKLKYRLILKKKLNIENPQTFNEKLQWLKLHDRNPLYTKLSDKYEVREYVKNVIGEEYLVPLFGVYNRFDEIDFDKLPNKFVIKCTHDSGGVVICKNKLNFDYAKAKKKINKCLKRNYYYSGREWPYKDIKPKIIIEKYLIDESSQQLNDYKFFIFNEELAYSLICSNRENNLKFTFFDKNGNFMDFCQDGCPNDKKVSKPKNYKKMVNLAIKLSKGIPQIRVDFYEINDKIYFGELTFYDSSGFGKFEPEEFDLEIGKMLKLPFEGGEKNEK